MTAKPQRQQQHSKSKAWLNVSKCNSNSLIRRQDIKLCRVSVVRCSIRKQTKIYFLHQSATIFLRVWDYFWQWDLLNRHFHVTGSVVLFSGPAYPIIYCYFYFFFGSDLYLIMFFLFLWFHLYFVIVRTNVGTLKRQKLIAILVLTKHP